MGGGGAGGSAEGEEIHPYYSFPPFFTIQPNEETKQKQLQAWCDLVTDYCRKRRVFEFDPATFPPFENKAIERSLSESAREAVLSFVASQGRCERHDRRKVFVTWTSFEEWGKALLEWAHRTGRREDVMTVDELCTSDDFATEAFHGCPPAFMQKILKELEKGKHVMLFQGSDQDDQGVKFL
mmetsp:Transcript_14671/g.30570  ORF Transcript_14671/g.30570 Transcript_14671/m.30570 type:complete len:182 (-) Transcript_14671:188-733(-)